MVSSQTEKGQKTDAPTQLAQFTQNAWDWDLVEFCRQLRIPQDAHAKDMFMRFQKAAELIKKFDASSLVVLSSPRKIG